MPEKHVIEIVKAYLALLNQEGITIDKAYLYGSYAREEASHNSDIDIMLVSSFYDSPDDEANIRTWSFIRKIDTRIEPFTVGLQQFFNDDVSPLLQIVKKEGIEIKF
jgi:predicted nucleotidyltransferase